MTRIGRCLIIVAILSVPASNAGAQEILSLSLDPSSGPPGTSVQASGTGFVQSPCGVNLFLDSTDGPFFGFASVDDGSFSENITIPPDTTIGEHNVIAQGLLFAVEFCDGPSGEEAVATFTVAAPLPPPSFSLQTFPVGEGAKGVATGDFNSDGILDLVAANQDADTVTLLTGFGDGIDVPRQFREAATLAVGKEPRSIAVADFDNDGLLDFAVTSFRAKTVSVLFQMAPQDTTLQFFPPVTIAVDRGPSDLVAGDFNQDGLLDLAVANTFSDTISIILGQENGEFSLTQSLGAAEGPQSIESGDFNRDGIPDLVVANLLSDDVTLFLGDGEGGFEPSELIPPPVSEVRAFAFDVLVVDIAAGDLNRDGDLDVALVNTTRPQVELMFGDGAGGFVGSTSLPVGSGPRSVAVADVNVDGLTDLVVLNSYSDEVSLLLGLGGGEFAGAFNYTVGDIPQDLAVGAFNLDPGLDLFVTFADSVSVLASGGSHPSITAIGPTQGPLFGGTVLLIDGQNFVDGDTTVTIGGTPVPATDLLVAATNRIKLVVPPGAAGPADIVVTTSDGTDTAVGAFTYTAGPIPELDLRFTRLIFCNDPDGDSLSGLDDCRLNSTKDADAADLDGDGLLNIYAAKTHFHGGDPPDEAYLNTGSTNSIIGAFADDLDVPRNVTLATGRFDVDSPIVDAEPEDKVQYDVQLADLDDDGDLDVVAMDTDTLRILINDGTGNFTDETAARITWGFAPTDQFQWDDVDIGDVDNDGDLDIAGSSRWDHGAGAPPAANVPPLQSRQVLLLNDGTTNFTANFDLLADAATAAGEEPANPSHDVDLADIDNDGDLDVIFSGADSGPPRIFLNTCNDVNCTLDGPPTLGFQLVFPTDPTRLDPAPGTGLFHVAASRPFGPTDGSPNERGLKPLDFNDDGLVDLYFGGGADRIYINRGGSETGFFTLLQNMPFPSGTTYGGSVGDLDLDGGIDIVQAHYGGEPMIYLNRITPEASIDEINDSSTLCNPPFVAVPEPMRTDFESCAIGSRRDGEVRGSYWQAVTNQTAGGLDEPDGNKDTGLTPGSKTGFLGTWPQVLDAEVGDFDGDGDLDIIFSLGDHQARANRIYLNNTCETTLPMLTCPADVTVECDGSTDPANTGTPIATDLCDFDPQITFSDAEIPGICAEEKTITRTWTATNAAGNSSSCDQVISVVDTTPPVVTPGPDDQVCLWPPNHKYVFIDGVTSTVQIVDNCDPNPMPTQIVCASNQCDDAPCAENPGENGDGKTVNDCVYDPATDRLAARAERAGTDPAGRTYTLTLSAADSCNNVSDPVEVFFVHVPHDQNPKMQCISPTGR